MAMDPRHQFILRKLQKTIVKDLEVTDIIDTLISKLIVTTSLWEEIKRESSSESQNRKLLDHLPKRGPEAYSVFKEAIRVNYSWISNAMETMETEDCVDSFEARPGPNTPLSHLPANPPLSVRREQKTDKLRQGLTELLPGNYLVLHALQGYGKSTLASATLKDPIFVQQLFKSEIYWITFGQSQCLSENILIQLNVLFHTVWNLDHLSEPTSEDSLKYSLKRHFSEHNYALIILDDVNSQKVIDAFDFGCKTLVLTTDVDILRGRFTSVIEMSDGFSANESLDLFAKATGIPVSDLPKQARQIHEECKGMPLMISMLSAQFEDIKESLAEGQTSDEIWSYYLDTLREKTSDVIQESLERTAATFDICMKNMPGEDQRYYDTLAIFPEDVNIPTKTLSIFWGVTVAKVDARMLRFYKKCFACRQWHPGFNTYVYGVHKLHLDHLRAKLSKRSTDELQLLHKSYVEKNLQFCGSDFSKLPRDNYVHSYIGYHMEKGGLLGMFPELYLDFGFIESKVSQIGPGDLLIDLKKYRNYITQDSPDLLEKVEDLEKFLVQQASTLAEYRRRNCLDLVQVALKHPFQGFVRSTAEALANKRQKSLYLNHMKHNTENSSSYSEELHLQVRSVAFTSMAEVILVGNDEGKVVSWNCNSRQHVAFYGHNSEQPIVKIVAPGEGKFFVSISGDGRAKLFDLRGDWTRQEKGQFKTLHPRAKQPEWINMLEPRASEDDSKVTFQVPGEKILDIAVAVETRRIAACTDSGTVVMWDLRGQEIFSYDLREKTPLTSLAFTMSSALLHAINIINGSLLTLDANTGQYKTQFSLQPETAKIISLLSVPQYCNLLVILLETKIYKFNWPINDDTFRGPQRTAFASLEDKGITYTSAAVTRDGKYIVTADTGGSVNVYDLHDRLEVIRTFKNLIFSLDTHWLEDEGCHIICGGNRDTLVPMVHRWKFDPKAKPVVRRLPLFDATMKPGDEKMIAVAMSSGTVQIIQNDDVIAETPAVEGKITSLVVYDNGNEVVYGTEKGSVFLFDIRLNYSREIMELSEPVRFIRILKIEKQDVIVCGKGSEDLQIWRSDAPYNTQLVEDTGTVIYCEVVSSVRRVLTVADKALKLWDQDSWRLQAKHVSTFVTNISCCSLSVKQKYLAVANAEGNLNVLKLITRPDIRSVKFQESMLKKFTNRITACSFSHDEELLAVGFSSGEINIIDIQTRTDLRKLEFHRRPVKHLYWCPADIEVPILLSLANELAWWNVSTEAKKPSAQREISHSLSELTITSPESKRSSSVGKMRTSRSLELGSVKVMEKLTPGNDEEVFLPGDKSSLDSLSESNSEADLARVESRFGSSYSLWSQKVPKFIKIDGLLGVVKLDGDLATKVCIDKDFKQFLTLNGEGSIYNLTILEPGDEEIVNGDT